MKNIDDIDILMMDRYVEDENKTAYNKIKRMILTRAKSIAENNSTLPPKQEKRSRELKPFLDDPMKFNTDDEAKKMGFVLMSDYSEYVWCKSFRNLIKREACDGLPRDRAMLFGQVGSNVTYTNCWIHEETFKKNGFMN